MQDLIDLVQIVDRNKVKRIEVIGHPNNYKSNIQELYEGITSGKFKEDIDAINHFYPNLESPNATKNLRRLKKRLQEKLLNTLIFLDNSKPSFTANEKAYYDCYKNYVQIKILLGRNARKLLVPLAEKTLNKAQKFEFTDLTMQISGILRRHYGSIAGDLNRYKKYKKILNEGIETYQAELKAEDYYLELASNYVNSRATKVEIAEKAEKYEIELRELLKEFKSYRFILYSYSVFVLRYQIVNDYESTILACKEAVEEFEQRKHLASKTAIYTFLFYTLRSCIPLKYYEKGIDIAQKCLEYASEGSINWFATLEQYLILSFHSLDFQRAFEIFIKAYEQKDFNKMPSNLKEYWKIHEAFIHYLLSIGKIQLGKGADRKHLLKKFKIGKFINEVPTFSKDKRGTNITILIIQILFLLQQKKYPIVIDKMEALNIYCHRYLRKDDTFRSNCFIKMLMQLPKARFNKIGSIRRSEKYYSRLNEVPINIAKQSNEIEIIPYNILWEFTLDSLDNKFY